MIRRRRCRKYRRKLDSAAEKRSLVSDIALRRHLRSCEACRSEFNQFRSIGRALRAIPVETIQGLPTVAKHRLSPKVRGALGAAAVLASALGAVGASSRRRS